MSEFICICSDCLMGTRIREVQQYQRFATDKDSTIDMGVTPDKIIISCKCCQSRVTIWTRRD